MGGSGDPPLALHGRIDLNASVFRVLKIKPAGPVVNNRMYDITFNHLLEHKAGWQGEPLNRANQAYEAARRPGTPAPPWSEVLPVLLRHIMVQRLAWTPGEKSEYDNMGYHVLKLMIMRVSGRSLPEYYRSELCHPFGLSEVKWIRQGGVHRPGEPPRLWNGLHGEENDAMSLGISTPALCTFMRCLLAQRLPAQHREPGVDHVWRVGQFDLDDAVAAGRDQRRLRLQRPGGRRGSRQHPEGTRLGDRPVDPTAPDPSATEAGPTCSSTAASSTALRSAATCRWTPARPRSRGGR